MPLRLLQSRKENSQQRDLWLNDDNPFRLLQSVFYMSTLRLVSGVEQNINDLLLPRDTNKPNKLECLGTRNANKSQMCVPECLQLFLVYLIEVALHHHHHHIVYCCIWSVCLACDNLRPPESCVWHGLDVPLSLCHNYYEIVLLSSLLSFISATCCVGGIVDDLITILWFS